VVLAPLSGVTDAPFRALAEAEGAQLTIAEMIASEGLARGWREAVAKTQGYRGAVPRVVQIAGRQAHWMARAAEIARDHGAQTIDINMGCPAKKVSHGGSGAVLMRDLDHARVLIAATVRAADPLAVTLKCRLGWDETERNAAELGRIAEAEGVKALTVHGRTRQQFYKGAADWHGVGQVVEALDIPVTVNGDITSPETLLQAMSVSGAASAMVGRAATGRAWMPAWIAGERPLPSWEEHGQCLIALIQMAVEHHDLDFGLRTVRKHIAAGLDQADPAQRQRALTAETLKEACSAVREAVDHLVAPTVAV
jgi:nifR3 family TIM-barrel protein